MLMLMLLSYRRRLILVPHSRRSESRAGLQDDRVFLLVLEWKPLVGGVAKRCRHDNHRTGGQQGPHNAATDDVPLPAGQVYGQPGGGRGSRRREEGPSKRKDLEATVEGDDGAGGCGLAKGDVGDGAGAAHDANTPLSSPGESGDAVHDVGAVGDLDDVSLECVGAVSGDDDRWLWLVLRPRRSPPRPPHDHGLLIPCFSSSSSSSSMSRSSGSTAYVCTPVVVVVVVVARFGARAVVVVVVIIVSWAAVAVVVVEGGGALLVGVGGVLGLQVVNQLVMVVEVKRWGQICVAVRHRIHLVLTLPFSLFSIFVDEFFPLDLWTGNHE
ncbi:hypothetical protein Dimus_008856 [Dionaea muscipula]